MREIVVTLEREEDVLRVVSDVPGFYLWGMDYEKVLGSIIPLAQHCIWRNERLPMVPECELDHQKLLEEGELIISFTPTDVLKETSILVEGQWWKSPQGNNFFVPENDLGEVDVRTAERIKQDLDRGVL